MPPHPRFARRTQWDLAPNRFTQALERHRAAGRELLDLTESNPTRCGLAYDEQAILRALADPRALAYQPDPRGLPHAREAVASYYAERGEQTAPERIFLTTSTSEAYSWVFRLLCEPGDEVLAPAPSYPLFSYLAGIQDVQLRHYPLFYDHGWHVDLHALAQQVTERTRAVLVVHPNNPTGSFVKPGEAAALNALCAERGLALVADEVFLDYTQPGAEATSFAANRDVLTFTLSGLSKIAALPQMKLAWLVLSGPEELADEAARRLEVIADTYLSLNAPVQWALPALLELRHAVQQQLNASIAANLKELDAQLASCSALRRLEFEGGWYAVLRVPVTGSDEDLAIALLEQASVLAHPGHLYDFAQDGFLVVSLITPPARFSDGVRRLLRHLSRP
jgi:alanine-synthesizing transaminase